jgi:predicted 3-demethylubiquinone-9 3-methyltransferase (glyoxalase superfamily)
MLWYNDQAEEAAKLYLSIFGSGTISNVSRGPDGKAFTVNFDLLGENYIGLNGGPMHTFSEGFSIFVHCDGQDEVDRYWNAFIESGGTESRCGWLKDKFGLSWQIIPRQLGECLGNPDPAKAGRAMAAMMGMTKIIVSDLESAVQ